MRAPHIGVLLGRNQRDVHPWGMPEATVPNLLMLGERPRVHGREALAAAWYCERSPLVVLSTHRRRPGDEPASARASVSVTHRSGLDSARRAEAAPIGASARSLTRCTVHASTSRSDRRRRPSRLALCRARGKLGRSPGHLNEGRRGNLLPLSNSIGQGTCRQMHRPPRRPARRPGAPRCPAP